MQNQINPVNNPQNDTFKVIKHNIKEARKPKHLDWP